MWTVQIQSEEKNQDLNVDYWVGGEPDFKQTQGGPIKQEEAMKASLCGLPFNLHRLRHQDIPIPPYLLD